MLDETSPVYVDLSSSELLDSVDFVSPGLLLLGDKANGASASGLDLALDPVASTTLLQLPVGRAGFKAAATALQWAIRASTRSGEVTDNNSASGEDVPAEHVNQRVGFVWALDAAPLVQQEEVVALLAQLHSLGSVDGICGASCAAQLLKVGRLFQT
jgi:hypothetical protein